MAAALADPEARSFLRNADRVLAQVIDAQPDFHPRAWLDHVPPLSVFGTLIFQVAGQQLSVSRTRTIVSRLQERFGGHLPSPPERLAADPQEPRASGMSARKGATLRALAERFVDGGLQELTGREALTPVFDDLNNYEATTHFNGQSTIALEGDRATGEGDCLAHHLYTEDGERKLMVASLRYLDTFVKSDGVWLFAERKLIVDWTDTRPSHP